MVVSLLILGEVAGWGGGGGGGGVTELSVTVVNGLSSGLCH